MEQILDKNQTPNPTKPRNWLIAFLLSLFIPGLGQVYNGQPNKAAIFFCLILIVPVLFGLTSWITFFWGFILILSIELIFRIYVLIDVVKNANLQNNYVLKPYNTWYYYLLISMVMLAILIIIDTRSLLGIQTFSIPTTSNNPTIQSGDCVIADLKAYKKKKPDYGDIVVFKRPDGVIYNFRIVGLPNDHLELIDDIVTVNGEASKTTFIKDTTIYNFPTEEISEELPNGHNHLIYRFKQTFDSTKTNIKNIVVPPNSYYLLGDNRDNSADSRFIGFVNKDEILGRIAYSYWSKTTKRINIDFRDK